MNNYCLRDGTPFDAQGICPTCGSSRASQTVPAPPPQPYTPQPPYPPQGYAPQPPQGYVPQPPPGYAPQPPQGYVPQPPPGYAPAGYPPVNQRPVRTQPLLISVCWDYIKAFFSKDPMNCVRNAAQCSRPIWTILGLGGMLLVALGVFAATGFKLYKSDSARGMGRFLSTVRTFLVGREEGNYINVSKLFGSLHRLLYNGAAIYFLGLAVLLIIFFLNSATLRMVFAVGKQRVTMNQVFNLQAASLLPVIAASLAACILAFISPLLSITVMIIGAIIATIQQYFGIQKAASFGSSPLWAFALKLFADAVGVFLVILLLASVVKLIELIV